jgi:hypothetical protein
MVLVLKRNDEGRGIWKEASLTIEVMVMEPTHDATVW